MNDNVLLVITAKLPNNNNSVTMYYKSIKQAKLHNPYCREFHSIGYINKSEL